MMKGHGIKHDNTLWLATYTVYAIGCCWCCRSRRAEAKIQQMLWKINHSDIIFTNTTNSSSVIYSSLRVSNIKSTDEDYLRACTKTALESHISAYIVSLSMSLMPWPGCLSVTNQWDHGPKSIRQHFRHGHVCFNENWYFTFTDSCFKHVAELLI